MSPADDGSAASPAGARRAALALAAGRPLAANEVVRREGLDYDAFLAHREVHRLSGTTAGGGGERRWSLIEKTTEGPATASRYLRENAVREHAAYTGGLLGDLAPRVRAPQLLGAHEAADGHLALWLEDVVDESPRPRDATSILAAAEDLGTLAGRHLGRVPDLPWLFTVWIARHAQPEAVPASLRLLDRAGTRTTDVLGHRIGEVRRLIAAQPRLRRALEALPSTLCHHDAVGANILHAGGETVLLDWESVGPGPCGADLASLLFASVRRGDASAEVVLPLWDLAVDAYCEGVAQEHGRVDVPAIRSTLDAAVCLRWKLAVDVIEALERRVPVRRGSAPEETAEQALEELRQLTGLLLGTARRLL